MDSVSISMGVVVLLVIVALAFDFMNGFHDGANSISTIVATGALTPRQAVAFAAFFNFVAIWVFHLKVAATIGNDFDPWTRLVELIEAGVADSGRGRTFRAPGPSPPSRGTVLRIARLPRRAPRACRAR